MELRYGGVQLRAATVRASPGESDLIKPIDAIGPGKSDQIKLATGADKALRSKMSGEELGYFKLS